MVKFHCKDNQKALQDFKHLAGLFMKISLYSVKES
jgi:hypothetical protein